MNNPVTAQMLREDWADHPALRDKPELRAQMDALSDAELQAALDKAFQSHKDMWCWVLDNTRNDATEALLRGLTPLG